MRLLVICGDGSVPVMAQGVPGLWAKVIVAEHWAKAVHLGERRQRDVVAECGTRRLRLRLRPVAHLRKIGPRAPPVKREAAPSFARFGRPGSEPGSSGTSVLLGAVRDPLENYVCGRGAEGGAGERHTPDRAGARVSEN